MIAPSVLPSLETLPPTPADAGTRLTADQLGHLRHLDNISRLPDNDWSGMEHRLPVQDDGSTLRYQLGYGALALSLAHLHRLPAAPGLFKPILARLIHKILLPSVWLYWRDVSRAGGIFNSHITREEMWNPVERENIMYSGYIHMMVSLFDYLFDDHRFTEPESIVFEHSSPFWGGSSHRFAYDRDSLVDGIYWQMVQNGFLGVACQPNCVFQVCNQPAILGFRLNDLVTGQARAAEATAGYQRAWEDLGQFDPNGHFTAFVKYDSKTLMNTGGIGLDAWLGTLLNMWNPALVRQRYGLLVNEHVYETADGTRTVRPPKPLPGLDALVLNPHGWVSTWSSEMGDQATLDGLFGYADAHLGRSWKDGGLFYPRNDQAQDQNGDPIRVDPTLGNVLLAYARLNIPDGIWRLYNQQLRPGHHTDPALTGVARDVDVSQAVFDRDTHTLTVTARRRRDLAPGEDDEAPGTVELGRLSGHGPWTLRRDGVVVESGERGGSVVLACPDVTTTYELRIDGRTDDA